MPQLFWKYENKSGLDYEVRLYHGDTSGHVILYSGLEIIKIDFNVSSNKDYSFLLGEELFKLSIFFNQGTAKYDLINTETNQHISTVITKDYPTAHIAKAVLFIILVILAVVLVGEIL